MHEDGEFEGRVAGAVRSFADSADTRVDAVAVAMVAMQSRRPWAARVLRPTGPWRVAMALAILLTVSAGTTALVGAAVGWFGEAPMPAPIVATTPAPTPTPVADGYVTGTWTFDGTTTIQPTAGHTFVNAIGLATNDARVNGDATFDAGQVFPGASWMPATGYTWAVMTIRNSGGSWSGRCKGASWGSASTVLVSCELNGADGYAGNGFFVLMRGGEDIPLTLEGVIYAGDIPEE
jgi:hypothetical protein